MEFNVKWDNVVGREPLLLLAAASYVKATHLATATPNKRGEKKQLEQKHRALHVNAVAFHAKILKHLTKRQSVTYGFLKRLAKRQRLGHQTPFLRDVIVPSE